MTWQYYSPEFAYETIFPDLLYPWAGHKRFAYDLVRNTEPKVIVELGSYKGTSLFSFAQAALDGALATKIYAIDTWEGDEHAGEYGEEIYEEVVSIYKTHYAKVDLSLIRKRFEDAVSTFEDGSIDILHIDGLHTYDAVQNDYDTWIQKMAPDGLILFHDTEVRERDFGVWKFWSEISEKHPHVNFLHSFGLGVLSLSEIFPFPQTVTDAWLPIYATDFQYARLQYENTERLKHIANLEAAQVDLQGQLKVAHATDAGHTDKLHYKDLQIQQQEEVIRNLTHQLEHFRIVQLSLSYKIMRLHGSLTTMIRNPRRSLSDIRLAAMLLKREGFSSFTKRTLAYLQGHRLPHEDPKRPALDEEAYAQMISQEIRTEEEQGQFDAFWKSHSAPLISVLVPVYNISPDLLKACVDSVLHQTYSNWELCLYDDASTNEETLSYLRSLAGLEDKRIHVRLGKVNMHISGASNAALTMSHGEYIALLDHDDELHPHALEEVAKSFIEHDAEVVYTDEDYMDMHGRRFSPHLKPDFSPELLLSHNYVTHLLVFKKSLLGTEPVFREGTEGAQDHDLILRLSEKTTKIHHIAKVLYHWRYVLTSTSKDPGTQPKVLESAKKVLEDALKRQNINAEVIPANIPFFFQIHRKIIDNPKVSIIIPFKDKPELLDMALQSIFSKSTYQNFEVIGVSNNSEDKATFLSMKKWEKHDPRVRFIEHNVPFNYSVLNNFAIKHEAKGDYVVLMNNDIEIITPNWIETLLGHAQEDHVGVIGAKLYYPNDTIQHAGVVVGMGGIAGHAYKNMPRKHIGHFNRINVTHNVSAITAALIMVKRSIYDEVGGLDEDNLPIAFNDIDFCLRVTELGYRNVFTPFCEAYHHESISRGAEDTEEKQARFRNEVAYFRKRHSFILEKGDPFYSPHFSLHHEDYRLKLL